MTFAQLRLKRSRLAEFERSVRRERALVALFDHGQRRRFGWYVARCNAFVLFAGYAIAGLLSTAGDRAALSHTLLQRALVMLSWGVGAPAALAAARALAEHADRDALATLAVQRGCSKWSLLRARSLAVAVRIARLVALPAILLVAIALLRGAPLPWALAVLPAVIVYASALGLGLALLAYFSAELSVRHARATLLLLVLAPYLVSKAYSGVPSLLGLYSGLLSRLLDAGARLS